MTGQSQPLRANFRESVWKNRQKISKFSRKRTKIIESTGTILIKLGKSVHLRALQKVHAGILKILILRPVAPECSEMGENGILESSTRRNRPENQNSRVHFLWALK